MVRLRLAILALAVLSTASVADARPPVPIGSPGPFAGYVVEGSVAAHAYATPGPPINCILPVMYTVEMTYAPATDTLTLTANGVSATSSTGYAAVSFEAPCWTQFAITVAGNDVELVAAYKVTV